MFFVEASLINHFQVYKQKVKHLLYEHQNNVSELKGQGAVAIKLAQDEHRGNEMELRKDKRALKVSLKEQELSHEEIIKNLKKVRHNYFFNSLMHNYDF